MCDLIFPAGVYDARELRLAKPKGKNWWCVLYPQMCYVDAAWGYSTEESHVRLQNTLTKEEFLVVSAMEQKKVTPKIKCRLCGNCGANDKNKRINPIRDLSFFLFCNKCKFPNQQECTTMCRIAVTVRSEWNQYACFYGCLKTIAIRPPMPPPRTARRKRFFSGIPPPIIYGSFFINYHCKI